LVEGVKDYRAAVAIGRKLDLPELGPLLTSLASGLINLHELAEAQAVANEALATTRRDFGARHPIHARSLADAARVQSTLGNRPEALALMLEAVAIEEAAYAGSSSRLAISLQRLGWTYNQSGKYPEAIASFERAIAMEQGFAEPNWTNLTAAYNDMGDTYISIGDYHAARASLEAALEVWRDQELVINIGIALGNLGNASNRAQRFSEAAEYCQQGLNNDEQFLSADHPDLAYPLSCLGEALLGAEQSQSALAPLARAHALRDRVDMDEASLAWTRWLYGRALVESGENPSLGMRYVIFARDTFAGMAEMAASELADVQAWLATRQP
jgi:serine/threonine-protein kinase